MVSHWGSVFFNSATPRLRYFAVAQEKLLELLELGHLIEARVPYFGAMQAKPRHFLQVRLG
jgi:hypothetical protein